MRVPKIDLHARRRKSAGGWQPNSCVVDPALLQTDSPAAQAGLKKGDGLVELNGLNADKTGLFVLRYALCGGGVLTCVVRRGSQERRLNISQTR
jgi:S1-C subfamily serine protease